jgi:hypothetical protein
MALDDDTECLSLIYELQAHLTCPNVRITRRYVVAPRETFGLYRQTLDRLHELLARRYVASLRQASGPARQ